MIGRRTADPLVVPAKVQKRARSLLTVDPVTVVDQTLHHIWDDVSKHRRGDDRLNGAIRSTQVLLALLSEMEKVERD